MPSEKQIEAAADQISEGLGAFLRKFCDSEASKRARYYLHEMPKGEWNQMALMLATEALTAAEQAEPAWGDREDDLTDAIRENHPFRTKRFDIYERAQQLVSNRHSKAALIELVSYLLVQAEPALATRSGAVKAGEIMKAAWPEFGGNHQTAEFWQDFNEGVTFTLKHLAALEPAEPAADVEPVDHQWRPLEDGKPNFDWMRINEGGKPGWEILAKRNPGKYAIETRPLYVHPPESRLREALEHVTELLVDTWNTKMEGDPERQVAVRDARAALAQGADDERA